MREATSQLERGYRRVLACYPRAFRREGGDEILGSAAVHDLAAMQWPTVTLIRTGPWLAGAPIGAGVWLWLAWANGRGCHWARPAFVAFFGVLTIVVFFGLGEGTGEDAWPVTWPDLIATTVLWLVGLAAVLLTFSGTASPYGQQETVRQ
jgi:hypothetical protein